MSHPHPKLSMLLQISERGQIWPPKQLEGWWIVIRLDEIINSELNEQVQLQLALELGEKMLEKKLESD